MSKIIQFSDGSIMCETVYKCKGEETKSKIKKLRGGKIVARFIVKRKKI